VIVAYFLLKESRKLFKTTTSNLVFSFHSLSSNNVYGRLENIGNGTAFNIKVEVIPDFTVLDSYTINQAFDNVQYLAPKQYYDVFYGSINIYQKLLGFVPHKLKISWSNKKKSNKRNHFETQFEESYFDSFPTANTFDDLVVEIRSLNRNLKAK